MRYSDAHKEETRRRIVRAAAGAVRLKGPDGVGVAQVMAEVGLTHGGFYAHFPDKAALVEAAIVEAFEQGGRRRRRLAEGRGAHEGLAAFIDAYVSLAHRDQPDRGCPLTTIASEVTRQETGARRAMEAGLAGLIAEVAAALPSGETAAREDLARSAVAEMVGAVVLARSVTDPEAAERLLAGSRRRIKAHLGLDNADNEDRS